MNWNIFKRPGGIPANTPPAPPKVCVIKPSAQPGRPAQSVCFNALVAPVAAPPSFAPTGGPSSGLWANAGAQTAPAPAPTPTPPGPPPTPCDADADLFTNCFVSNTPGKIDVASPGPLNGWTYIDFFDFDASGDVTFQASGPALFNFVSGQGPGMSKPVAGLTSVNNLTLKYRFTEYPGDPSAVDYQTVVNDFANGDFLQVDLSASGASVSVGPQPNGWSNYTGAWTPTPGATHDVQVQTDNLGVPRMWVDGVEIALAFNSMGAGGPDYVPPNAIAFLALNFAEPAIPKITASLTNIFLATGSYPVDTVFCCS